MFGDRGYTDTSVGRCSITTKGVNLVAKKQEKQPWTISKTATVSFVASTLVYLIGYSLEPAKTAAFASAGFWALKNIAPIATTILVAFFALGWKRPDRKQALSGAVMGAVAGHIVGAVAGLLVFFLPFINGLVSAIVGRIASAYLSAAGTMLGELKEEK
jgi:hypothetical protein